MLSISRAAIIVPPLHDFYFTRHRFSSLGAHIVKKLVERAGIHATLFNFPLLRPHGASLPLLPELSYLRPYLIENETGRTSFFTRFRRYGPDDQTCVRMISDSRPDICFFSVFAFAYADSALALAGLIKKKLPAVPIVMGGGGPSSFPQYFLREAVDFVLTGEAEVCLNCFVREYQKESPVFSAVPNLLWKENGSIQQSSDAGIADSRKIEIVCTLTAESSSLTTFSTSLSRGCPMNCTFCSSHFALGKPFRTPGWEKIEEAFSSIEISANNYKKQIVINIEDDNILADDTYFKETLAAIRTRFPGAQFIMENGIDYRFLSPEKITRLMENGMKKFNLSLGSLDPEILCTKNRTGSIEQYDAVLDLLAKNRLPSITYFICGFKEDTIESVARTLRYLAARKTTIGISPFYAVPGIAGFTDKLIFNSRSSSLCLGAACYPWNGSLSTETLITAFRLSRYINLRKDSNRSEIESQLVDKINDTQELHTLIRKPGTKTVRIVEVERQDRDLVRLFFRG
jgi:anaerobic magnesium-protoporphyrin IX monomethyl ester cyclase